MPDPVGQGAPAGGLSPDSSVSLSSPTTGTGTAAASRRAKVKAAPTETNTHKVEISGNIVIYFVIHEAACCVSFGNGSHQMAISRCSSSTPRPSPIEVYAECDSIRQSHGLLLLAGTSEVDRDVSLGSDLVRLPGYGRLHRIEVSHGTALVTAVSWDGDCPCAEFNVILGNSVGLNEELRTACIYVFWDLIMGSSGCQNVHRISELVVEAEQELIELQKHVSQGILVQDARI
ncbi:hypothetical protein EJB05_15450, partial [Eragrostis curvula]